MCAALVPAVEPVALSSDVGASDGRRVKTHGVKKRLLNLSVSFFSLFQKFLT